MTSFTAFSKDNWLATGSRSEIIDTLRALPEIKRSSDILVFDDETGNQVDFDLRVNSETEAPTKRGRPKLGVISKEITLLPRHWDWLGKQSGGASATLRRLVDQARKTGADKRTGQDAAYHFLTVIAGDWPQFEEVIRALYADDKGRFELLSKQWSASVRDHAIGMAWPNS